MKSNPLDKAMSFLLIAIVVFFAMTLISECPGTAKGQSAQGFTKPKITSTSKDSLIPPTYRFFEPGKVVWERPPLTTWAIVFRVFSGLALINFFLIIILAFLTVRKKRDT